MKTTELIIEGMSCAHCVMSVRKELSKLPNVKVGDVQIGKANVTIDEAQVTEEILASALDEAGYRLVVIR